MRTKDFISMRRNGWTIDIFIDNSNTFVCTMSRGRTYFWADGFQSIADAKKWARLQRRRSK